jgi:hypothetical protein
MGHGTYVPMGIGASPVSVIPDVGVSCTMISVLWGAAGGLATSSKRRVPRYTFWLLMLLHYAALPLVLSDGERFGDWDYARRYPGEVWVFFAIYAIGQVTLWVFHVRAVRAKPKFSWLCKSCGYDRDGLPTDAKCPECGTVPAPAAK